MREELSAECSPQMAVWRCRTPWGVDVVWWLTQLAPGSRLVADPAEVDEIHWLTVNEMNAHAELLDSNRQFLAALRRGEIDIALDS